MNKICGYSCEHNKGGVCQITMCDKQIYITTKTDEPLQKQLEKYTKYKIQKDENFELRKIHELQQELQRKDKEIKHLKSELECYENGLYFSSEVDELQDKLDRKDNNWNELKNYVDKLYEDETYHSIGEVLDKIEDIESGE